MLAVLVAAALVSSFYLPLAGRRLRPEHVAGPLVFAAFVLVRVAAKERVLRLDAYSGLAAAWVVVNALSSWLFAPNPHESFVHVLRLGFLAVIFLTVANLPPFHAAAWRARVRMWLVLGMLEMAYGVIIWLLALYGNIWLPGAVQETTILGISIKGTQYERNLFGILAATLFAVSAYVLLAQRARGRELLAPRRVLVAACTLAGCAMVLSLTRSAWLSVSIAAPAAWLLFDRRGFSKTDRPLLQLAAGMPVAVAVLIAMLRLLPTPDAASTADFERSTLAPGKAIGDRLSTLGRPQSDFTLSTRLQDARWAIEDWQASPLLGRGTGSFFQIHGQRAGTDAWVSNLVLHTLLDTGLVGLAIQLCLFVLVAWRAWQASRLTRSAELDVGLKAMTVGFLAMTIAYQLTDGTWLAVFWIHLALMANGIYCVADERRVGAPA